jgi:hypothetical protein
MDRMNADRGVETHRGAEKGKVSHGEAAERPRTED